MKKNFLIILLLMAFALAATAQNKKIAILETVDKEEAVPYAVEVMVRSSLNKVISSTPGYEGYDRVDMSQIMGEQSFQRTGMVSEDQIKRLGEISGADYILVTEVVKYDESNIYVTAKILDVETAKMELSDYELMGVSAKEVQIGCEQLAKKLLGVSSETDSNGGSMLNDILNNGIFNNGIFNRKSSKSQSDSNSNTQPNTQSNSHDSPAMATQTEQSKQPAVVGSSKTKTAKTVKSAEEEMELLSKREYYYYLGDRRLTDDEYMELINNCPESHLKYEKGVRQKRAGNIILISGLTLAAAGVGVGIYGGLEDSLDEDVSIGIGGVGLMLGVITPMVAIPIKIAGKVNRKNAYKKYNEFCAQPKATLGFYPTANGVGVSLNF